MKTMVPSLVPPLTLAWSALRNAVASPVSGAATVIDLLLPATLIDDGADSVPQIFSVPPRVKLQPLSTDRISQLSEQGEKSSFLLTGLMIG